MTLETRDIRPETLGGSPEASQMRAPAELMEGLFASVDDWDKVIPKDAYKELETQLQGSPDKVKTKQEIAINAFLVDRFQIPPDQAAKSAPELMTHYAKSVWQHEGPIEVGDFYAKANVQIQGEKNAGLMSQKAVDDMIPQLGQKDFEQWFTEYETTLKGHEGYNPAHADLYRIGMRQAWTQISDVADRYQTEVEQVTAWFQEQAKIQSGEFDGEATMTAKERLEMIEPSQKVMRLAENALLSIPKQDRGLIMELAATSAGVETEERGFGGKMAEQFTRGLEKFSESVVGGLNFGIDRSRIRRDLTDRYNYSVDPVRASTWISNGLLSASESFPRTIAAASVPGLVAGAMAQTTDLSKEFADAGVTGWRNGVLSVFTAIPYMAMDRLEANMVFAGKIPGVKGFLGSIKSKSQLTLGSLAKRVGGTAALNTAWELGTELSQDALRPTIQEFASWLDDSVPDVAWKEEISMIAGGSLETLGALLPLVLIGTGRATFKDRSYGKAYVEQTDYLQAAGFDADQVGRIMAAKPELRETVVQKIWKERKGIGSIPQRTAVEKLNQQAATATASLAREAPTTPDEPSPVFIEQTQKIEKATVFVGQGSVFSEIGDKDQSSASDRVGQAVTNVTEVEYLQAKAAEWKRIALEQSRSMDTIDESQRSSAKAQFFREAFESATGTGGALNQPQDRPQLTEFPAEVLPDGTIRMRKGPEASETGQSNRSIPPKKSGESSGKYRIRKDENGRFIVLNPEGTQIGTANTQEAAYIMVESDLGTRKQKAEVAAREAESLETERIQKTNPTPESDGNTVPASTSALNKEEISDLRDFFAMDDIPAVERQRFEEVLAAAKRKDLALNADDLAEVLIANPRPVSGEEHAAMVLRATQLQNRYEEAMRQAAAEIDNGNPVSGRELFDYAQQLFDKLDRLTLASDLSGTEIARALNIRKMRINRDTFSLAAIIQRAKLAKQAPLTEAEQKKLTELAAEIEAANKRIAELETALKEEQDKQAAEQAKSFVQEGVQRRSSARKKDAAQRREEAKKRLAKLGYRLNDITNSIGMSVETASLVAQIAETYIEEGAATLAEVKAKVQEDIPDLSDQDVFNALGGRIKKEVAKIESEVQARIKEIKKQAKLTAQINDAMEGIFESKRPVAKDSKEVAELRKKLGKLRIQADKAAQSDAALQRIHEKINDIQDQLEGGFRNIDGGPKKKPEERIDVAAMRVKLNELKRLMRTEDSIADLEAQLRGDIPFKVGTRELKVVQNQQLQEALLKRVQLQRQVRNAIAAAKKLTAREWIMELMLAPRTLLATADMSATARQGLFLSVRRPTLAAKTLKNSVAAFVNQNSADSIYLAIQRHPNHPRRLEAGLFLSELDLNVGKREENFLSSWAEKIPGWGVVVRASNRHMVTHLNLLRVGIFDKFLESHPDASLEQKRAMARYINYASGRGSLGRFNGATKELNTVFFAPRYAVSRFQTLLAPFIINDSNVRKEWAKDMGAFLGTGMSVLLLASLAGAEVGLDPEDSDFGKIILGDTRIDIWGGLQQPARLMMTPFVVGADRIGIRDMKKNVDIGDAIRRFIAYKASPAVNIPLEVIQGRDVVGQETTLFETAVGSVVPLFLQDVYSVYRNSESLPKTALAAGGTFFGFGVNEFEDRQSPEAKRAKRLEELQKRLEN